MATTWDNGTFFTSYYNADCLEIIEQIGAGRVKAVITDPPYGVDYQSNHRVKTDKFKKIAGDLSVPTEWMHLCRQVIRADSCLLTFCAWQTAEEVRVALSNAGWTVKNQAIWDRKWTGMGDLKGSMSPVYDVIWFCAEDEFEWPHERPRNLFSYMRVSGNDLHHPNQKPLALMKELVRLTTREGDLVLDPFIGSCTTGVACIQLKRSFIGIEIDSEYYRTAEMRLRRAREKATGERAEG